ncbi:DUF4129 domain-containing protein [Kribbella sp. NPDC051770]|uniref:DUF4129 domain-containing protein n=1 Tax=Kribbella sp. NPDC051770 TaxID=3155413 RepID=UPI0034152D63
MRRTRGLWLTLGGLAAGVLIVIAAAAGSVRPWQNQDGPPAPLRTPRGTPTPPKRPESVPTATPGWWDWLVTGLLSVVLAVTLLVIARVVYVKVTDRTQQRARAERDAHFSRVAAIRDEQLEAALDAGLQAITSAAPTDAVIRCWAALESYAADAGIPREPSETSSEFTVRVLAARDVPPADLHLLASLYREARFSEHGIDEPTRSQAQEALTRLRAGLSR